MVNDIANTKQPIEPRYTPVDGWTSLSGMSRTATYYAIGNGHLRAIKLGKRTLIDVQRGLEWLASQPAADIRCARKTAA